MTDIIILGNEVLSTLVAVTPDEQAKGLMWKEWPPPVMTFPFDRSEVRSFWMKNTVSPLDIVFCNAGKVVSVIRGEPFSTQMIGPGQPSDLVVELPAGSASVLGVKPGIPVSFKPSRSTMIKATITQTYRNDRKNIMLARG